MILSGPLHGQLTYYQSLENVPPMSTSSCYFQLSDPTLAGTIELAADHDGAQIASSQYITISFFASFPFQIYIACSMILEIFVTFLVVNIC